MLINVDIRYTCLLTTRMINDTDYCCSTGAFYVAGSFLSLCVQAFEQNGTPHDISPRHNRHFTDRARLQLQRFITGIKVTTKHGKGGNSPRLVRKLSQSGANDMKFTGSDGKETSVAGYFKSILNRPLRYPDAICAEVCPFYAPFSVSRSSEGN